MSIHEIDMTGRIISMNRAGLLMLGLSQEHEVKGSMFLDAVSDTDRAHINELLLKAYEGETSHFEYTGSGYSGRIYKSCFVPIKNKNGLVEKLMGITEDITVRKQAEENVHRFAFYDTLTRLANRRMLADRLGLAMAASKRNGHYGVVLFLDLDNFKTINDRHGHDVGDLLLIEVAHRLTACVRKTDTVARLGGDEFVIILADLDVNKEQSVAQAIIVAEKIRLTLSEPYLLIHNSDDGIEKTVEHHCTSSIGAVLFNDHENSQEDLLKWADRAMYQAKEGGRNRIKFFEPSNA
jgi:diguanylate cyclase (GGDEF)-like protein/PAS domain S-box-containing protein